MSRMSGRAGHKAADTTARKAARATALRREHLPPDWIVLGLAALGVVLSLYLLLSQGRALPFCAAGSSCEIVQQSRWASLFGLPLALWGVGFHLLLVLVAVTGRTLLQRWQRLSTLALLGVLLSLYFNTVSGLMLQAVCLWCLLSLALLLAIFFRVLWQRPASVPGEGWGRWGLIRAIVLVPALGVIAAAQAGWLSPPADPRLEALALHLQRSGARYYGAFWCPQCQHQSDLFGRSAAHLPYVECSPGGRSAGFAVECVTAGVQNLPTWVIDGQTHAGVLQPEELARRSRFAWNAPQWREH